MLINNIFKQLILYILFFCSCNVFAFQVTENSNRIPWVTIDGPADRMQYMESIATNGSSTIKVCSSTSLTYNLGRVQYTPVLPFKESYQASSAHPVQNLFDIGVMGLASMPLYSAIWFNQTGGDMVNIQYGYPSKSVGRTSQTLWIGTVENADRGFYWGYQTYIYKSADQFKSGVFIIPKTLSYYMDCYDTEGTLQERYEFYSSEFQLRSNVTSCTPAETTKIINMEGIPLATLENAAVGSFFGTKQQSFSLTCDPNITVYISVNDLLTPSNVGGTVSSIESNGATGVGYVITSSANPNGMTLSASGSTPGTPNVHQYRLGNSGTADKNLMNYTLGFNYTKTAEEVTEGKANAIVGITYSYQ